MAEYLYQCAVCDKTVTLDRYGADGERCECGSGELSRVYSFFLAQVPGAGGSPGKRAGG